MPFSNLKISVSVETAKYMEKLQEVMNAIETLNKLVDELNEIEMEVNIGKPTVVK